MNLKSLSLTVSALCLAASFSSCNDKDAPEMEADKTYSGPALTVNYCGEKMIGKSVSVSRQGDKAAITLFSTISLTALPSGGVTTTVDGPGIIPGDVKTILLTPISVSKGKYTFSGSESSTFCSYRYAGSFDADRLTLDISDVTLKDLALSENSWTPVKYIPAQGEGLLPPVSSPISLKWTGDIKIPISQEIMADAEMIGNILINAPIFRDPASGSPLPLGAIIAQYVRNVSFLPNGNTIIQTPDSPLGGNALQYVPAPDNTLLLFPNITAIADNILGGISRGGSISSSTLINTIESLLLTVKPQLSQGFPLHYTITDNRLTLSPPEIATVIVKEALNSLLGDSRLVEKLLEALEQNPQTQQYIPVIKTIVGQLPVILEKTEAITLSLTFRNN